MRTFFFQMQRMQIHLISPTKLLLDSSRILCAHLKLKLVQQLHCCWHQITPAKMSKWLKCSVFKMNLFKETWRVTRARRKKRKKTGTRVKWVNDVALLNTLKIDWLTDEVFQEWYDFAFLFHTLLLKFLYVRGECFSGDNTEKKKWQSFYNKTISNLTIAVCDPSTLYRHVWTYVVSILTW